MKDEDERKAMWGGWSKHRQVNDGEIANLNLCHPERVFCAKDLCTPYSAAAPIPPEIS
jgi:hypothetical protein